MKIAENNRQFIDTLMVNDIGFLLIIPDPGEVLKSNLDTDATKQSISFFLLKKLLNGKPLKKEWDLKKR